ncbi:MAG TPA: hypothetical protein VF950_24505 [Planctomycetota bacterium]
MAKTTKSKGVRKLDRKAMKGTKGGIIAVLKTYVCPSDPTDCRKAGGSQESF